MNKIKKITIKVLIVFIVFFISSKVILSQTPGAGDFPWDPNIDTGTGQIDTNITDDTVTIQNTAGNDDNNNEYTLLAPITNNLTKINLGGSCPLAEYLGVIINIFLGIVAVLAMLMIVIGGIEYMGSELVSSKQAAKQKILNAILGLLIALGAYLILETINPDLLNVCLDLETATIELEDEPQQPVNGMYCQNPSYAADTPWTVDLAGPIPNLPSGVLPNNGECSSVGQSGCTSLKGLNPIIVNTIKSNCPDCHLFITGGTECWLHSATGTHKAGSSTVDLRATESLNFFLTGSNSFPTSAIVIYKLGIRFLAEQPGQFANTTGIHWHVSM